MTRKTQRNSSLGGMLFVAPSSGGGAGGSTNIEASAAALRSSPLTDTITTTTTTTEEGGTDHNHTIFSLSESSFSSSSTSPSDGDMTQDTTPLTSSSPSSSPESKQQQHKMRRQRHRRSNGNGITMINKRRQVNNSSTVSDVDEGTTTRSTSSKTNVSGNRSLRKVLFSRFTKSSSNDGAGSNKGSQTKSKSSNKNSKTGRRSSKYGSLADNPTVDNTNSNNNNNDRDTHHDHDDRNGKHTSTTAASNERNQQEQQREVDPVMKIFESRKLQRVRFCLEGTSTNHDSRSKYDDNNSSNNYNGGTAAVNAVGGGSHGTMTTTSSTASNNIGTTSLRSSSKNRLLLRGNETHPTAKNDPTDPSTTTISSGGGGTNNIKQFMSRVLFGSKSNNGTFNSNSNHGHNQSLTKEEIEKEVKEVGGGSLFWESASTPTGPEIVATRSGRAGDVGGSGTDIQNQLTLSFTEDPKARVAVSKLLAKAHKAERIHFRYEYAVRCYLKAVSILQKAKYPNDHPTMRQTVSLLNNSHHVLSSYNNSAEIVKIGIRNEDSGELIKALKMYTIAYRIRRDNLSQNHPSLVVLLNMLGSIQIKRGELTEAMQIYELALNDTPVMFSAASEDEDEVSPPIENLLAKSVTYREMGTIYEMWGRIDEALQFFHKSLECVAEWRETVRGGTESSTTRQPSPSSSSARRLRPTTSSSSSAQGEDDSSGSHLRGSVSTGSSSRKSSSISLGSYGIENVQPMSSVGDRGLTGPISEHGEMELVIGASSKAHNVSGVVSCTTRNAYAKYFPNRDNEIANDMGREEHSHADMDLALTLHQIAQLHRAQGNFARALDAYEVALKVFRSALGKHHPNCAAVLGNIGNLQKEMGDLDAAYTTYQEVLGIESYRLGLSHPDVAITLHNIATIDAALGNYEHSLELYRKVIDLQKTLFGEENLSVAITAACMGDVYEKIGQIDLSVDSFEEAVRIKSVVLGRHSLDVGRLLHKLGKLSFVRKEYLEAESFISRAILIYRLNKLNENHEWFVDAYRDTADIDGMLATSSDAREI